MSGIVLGTRDTKKNKTQSLPTWSLSSSEKCYSMILLYRDKHREGNFWQAESVAFPEPTPYFFHANRTLIWFEAKMIYVNHDNPFP